MAQKTCGIDNMQILYILLVCRRLVVHVTSTIE